MVSFRSYEWEGKGLRYYIKDTIRNRPQMFLVAAAYIVGLPIMIYCLNLREETRSLDFSRFRTKYIVYRDDDPRVRNIIKFDDNGNRVYLEPRKN